MNWKRLHLLSLIFLSNFLYSQPCDTLGISFEIPFVEASCLDDISPAALGIPNIDTTCCPNQITVSYADSISDYYCENSYTINRIWTAQDDCGNTAVGIQVIVLTDTIPPTFDTTPPSDTISVACYKDIPAAAVITASDACGSAQVIVDEKRVEGGCAGQFMLQRNWVAIDMCNNVTVSDTQYIIVQDTVAPTFNEATPNDTIILCNEAVPDPDTLTAYDCTNDIISNIPALTNDYYLDMEKIISGYNSLNDGYGVLFQDVSVSSILENGTPQAVLDYYDTIYVTLTVSPVAGAASYRVKENNLGLTVLNSIISFSFSHDVIFQASGNPWMQPKEKITFYGDGDLFYPFPVSGGTDWGQHWSEPDILTTVSNPYIIYNMGDVTYDRAAHVYGGVGTNLSFRHESPGDDIGQYYVSVFMPELNDYEVEVNFSETVTAGTCPSNYVIERTWTASDTCGNQNVHTQIISVQDTIGPSFGTYSTDTIFVACQDEIPVASAPAVTDDCGVDSVYLDELRIDGACFGQYMIERTWVALDECGNVSQTAPQYIVVNDTIEPVFIEALPSDTTVNCDATLPLVDTLTWEDCTVNIASDTNANFKLDGAYLLQVQEAMNGYNTQNGDPFGVVGTYLVNDYLYYTGGASPVPVDLEEFNGVTFTITTVDLSPTNAPSYVAPNGYGNGANLKNAQIEVTFSEDVFLAINGGPKIRAQERIEFSGDGNIFVPYPNGVGNHNQPELIASLTSPYSLYNPQSFDPSNANNNAITQTRSIYAGRGTQFIASHFHDVSSGSNNLPLFEFELFPSQDTAIFTQDTILGSCSNQFEIKRTWTAVDHCGNVNTHVQTITVQDTIAPVFDQAVLPADTTVSCDAIPAPPVLTATDNCSAASVTMTEDTLAGSCANNYDLERTWIATDSCGNFIAYSQIISVVDTVAPVFSAYPSDTVLNNDLNMCSAIVSWTEPTFVDACGSTSIVQSHTNGASFPVGSTEVWYTATDECGNADSISFNITVMDHQKPNVAIQIDPSFCQGQEISWVEIIDDNCGVDTIVSNYSMTDDFEVGTTTVSYTVTDIHGNDSTYSFEVVVHPLPVVEFVNDNVVSCISDDVTLEVDNPNPNYTYDWLFDDSYIGSGVNYTINASNYADEGIYSVEVSSNEGCVDTFDISVDLELCDIVVVESFSPNADGINDYFTIDNIEAYPGTIIKIFNRWGALVYESDNYMNDWNGTSTNNLNVGGNELPEGTYYYIIQLSGNEDEIYKGYVYLKR